MFTNIDKLDAYVTLANDTAHTEANLRELISMLDLTSLSHTDTKDTIRTLCEKALTPFGSVAAVCIYPQFISVARKLLRSTSVNIATVCNFPSGTNKAEDVLQEIEGAIANGANEIDMVIPYQEYVAGRTQPMIALITAAKQICGKSVCLKVILETGILVDLNKIYQASMDAINAGADFLKTSTGKVPNGANFGAAFAMFSGIKATGNTSAGFKAAGGIRSVDDAITYITIAKQLLGDTWVTPTHFRIGASGLLDNILRELTPSAMCESD